jgi:hypothetical protein
MFIHIKTFKEEIMEDILKKMIEERIRTELINDAEYVGELPPHLLEKLRALRNESERFDEDLELKQRQYALELKRKIEEEFDGRHEEYRKNHHAVWNEIYRVMNVDSEGHYYNRNGKLYAEKGSFDSPSKWTKKEMDFTKPFGTERF